jgi:hypothetical protein
MKPEDFKNWRPGTLNLTTGIFTPDTKPPKSIKKYHRRKKKPKPPKVKPAKAILPDGLYFFKNAWEKRSVRRKERSYKRCIKQSRAKLRGKRKKEVRRQAWLAEEKEKQMLKEQYGIVINGRLGKKMYSKPASPHRLIIYPEDICSIMGLRPRPAREYLTRLRKEKDLPKRSPVPFRAFIEYTGLLPEDVIPHLK